MKNTNTTRLVMLSGDGSQCVVYEGRWALAAFNVNRPLERGLDGEGLPLLGRETDHLLR